MKKILITCTLLILATTTLLAQQPKLYLKAYIGGHGHKYIYREEIISEEYYPGWQGGFGFRVSYRDVFAEVDFEFFRSQVTVNIPDSVSSEIEFFDLKLNSMNIPLKIGYIPVKTPFFKWYIYGGLSNRINTRAIIVIDNEEYKFKPKEVSLRGYNLDFILGTQADIGWLNVEFYYGTGLTNSTRSGIRTNSHQLILNVGFIF